MTGPIIQVPYLRPDPIHEIPDQTGAQLSHLAQLLMLKRAHDAQMANAQQQLLTRRGELALEQSKFDAQQKQQNLSNKQRQDAIAALDHMLSGGQLPPPAPPKGTGQPQGQPQAAQPQGAQPQAAPQPGIGEIAAAFPAIAQHLAQTQTEQTENAAIGNVLQQYQGRTDATSLHELALHIAAINPQKSEAVMNALRNPQEQYQPIVGQDGDIYTLDKRSGKIQKTGFNSGAKGQNRTINPELMQFAARNALQALVDANELLKKDPNADILPSAAAAIQGAGTTGVGALVRGALGPLAQQAMTPNQQMFQRKMDQFLHNYGSLLPRGQRSMVILNNLRASFSPVAGQTDTEVRNDATQMRNHLMGQLRSLASGQAMDMTALPGFNEASQDVGGYAPGSTPSAPVAAPPGPPNIGDFLQGVPK